MSSMFEALTVEKREERSGRVLFGLKGVIDAHAAEALKVLEQVPDQSEVVLDFAEVRRVNSMGLALLAQEAQVLEGRGCRVRVENPNRMVSILFKVSGFGRWIGLAEGVQRMAQPSTRTAAPPSRPPTPILRKWSLTAEVGISHQLNGWFLFNTYLQRQLHINMVFRQLEDGEVGDLVFVNPCRSAQLILEKQYEAVAKPLGETDEVVIATRSGGDYAPEKWKSLAVAHKQSLTYLLGRFLLDEVGVNSEKLTFVESRTEIKAIQMLIRGQVDAVFLSKRTFDGLSSFSKRQLETCDQSQVELAANLFCISPRVPQETKEKLAEVLFQMVNDPKGEQLLKELEIKGWAPVAQEELDLLLTVYQRYLGA